MVCLLNFFAALEIVVYSALFCLPVLLPIAATDKNNVIQLAKDKNYTYSNFDNLGMANIQVKIPESLLQVSTVR